MLDDQYQKIVKTDRQVYYEKRACDEIDPNLNEIHNLRLNCNSHPTLWFNFLMPRQKGRQEHADTLSVSDFVT